MKRIEAIIRPHRQEAVLQALSDSSALGVSVLDSIGFGRQSGHSDVYQSVDHDMCLVPKRMLIMYVNDDQVESIVKVIQDVAQTGKYGDGKIAVTPLDDLVRIRTGEAGESAL